MPRLVLRANYGCIHPITAQLEGVDLLGESEGGARFDALVWCWRPLGRKSSAFAAASGCVVERQCPGLWGPYYSFKYTG